MIGAFFLMPSCYKDAHNKDTSICMYTCLILIHAHAHIHVTDVRVLPIVSSVETLVIT